MNREIKFRAWDGERKEMFYPSQLTGETYKRNQSVKFICRRFTGDSDSVLMQYTGLTDRHGKEIYEGDIVSFLDEHYEIIYMEQYASFMLSKGNDLQNITTQEEVIGNIHENPELLN